MGAPRKHPPKNAAETIEQLASQGHAIIGIAKQLGVSRDTFKRWCEEDDSLQEAFDLGRETQRQALIALIVQAAVLNKGANANAMFLLKTMHGFREMDSPHTKVNVGVNVAPNVLVIKDHGTDEEWAAKAAEQQRKLMIDAEGSLALHEPPVPQASASHESSTVVVPVAASWVPPQSPVPLKALTEPTPPPSRYDAPAWKANA
jgi:transposase-like protein